MEMQSEPHGEVRDLSGSFTRDRPAEGQELGRWLYSELRAAILDGRLKPGSRMPSTRGLSKQYALARGTVAAAFEQLKNEGYVEATVGAGTFVSASLPDESLADTEWSARSRDRTIQGGTLAARPGRCRWSAPAAGLAFRRQGIPQLRTCDRPLSGCPVVPCGRTRLAACPAIFVRPGRCQGLSAAEKGHRGIRRTCPRRALRCGSDHHHLGNATGAGPCGPPAPRSRRCGLDGRSRLSRRPVCFSCRGRQDRTRAGRSRRSDRRRRQEPANPPPGWPTSRRPISFRSA